MTDIIDRIYREKTDMTNATGLYADEIYMSHDTYQKLCEWDKSMVKRDTSSECDLIFDMIIKQESISDNLMVLLSNRSYHVVKWAFKLDSRELGQPESIPLEPPCLHHQCHEMQKSNIPPIERNFMGWSYYGSSTMGMSGNPLFCKYCNENLDSLWEIHKHDHLLKHICKE